MYGDAQRLRFNTRIDNLPVDPNSASWVPYILSNGVFIGYQWGFNIVDNSTPAIPQSFRYTTYLNGTAFPIPPTAIKKRETGAFPNDPNNDHHTVMLNRQTCQFYEEYQEGVAIDVCPTCTAASGYTYPSTNYTQALGSTDAAGLPLTPLTLHLSEIKAGAVNHAIRFTGCLGCISNQSIWPATYSTGAQAGAPPMGARFRLKSSFDISGFPPAAQVVLRAMQQYGIIIADIGTTGGLTASTDITEDTQVVSDLYSIQNAAISYTNFEAVDESSLMVSASSTRANPSNPYVQVPNSVTLTVVDANNPANVVQVPIALQAIGVGMPDPTMTIQAGTYGIKIPYWVTGTTNQAVTWSLNPSVGSGTISADGVYTPPASVAGITNLTLTATGVADPTAQASISVNIVPTGVIRIDSGSQSATQDDQGNTWLPDTAFETASSQIMNDSYPSGAWGAIANASIWETYTYTWGDDIVYRMHVPNGTYNVALLFAKGSCDGTYSPTSQFDDGLIWGPMNIEAQGQIAMLNWDPGAAINYACRTPNTLTIPVSVTDTSLEIGIRATGGAGTHSAPFINGLTITPVTGTAQLQVSPQAVTFPSQAIGTSAASQAVAITNSGTASAMINAVGLTGTNSADFSISSSTCGSLLAAGASCQIAVTFTPSAAGNRSAALTVTSSAANSPVSVALSGTGLGQPKASLSTTALSFGTRTVGTASPSQTVTLSSIGSGPLTLTSVTFTGSNPGSYLVTANTCPASIASGTSCQINVVFKPVAMGSQTSNLIVATSAGQQPVSLSGRGTK